MRQEQEEKKKRGRKPRRVNCKMVSFEIEIETIRELEERAETERTSKTAIFKAALAGYLGKPAPFAAIQELDDLRARLATVRRVLFDDEGGIE